MHVMLDLETWGTYPGCAIRSIGAVAFSLGGAIHSSTFYRNIEDASCEALDMHKDGATEVWWSKQPAAAQELLGKDQQPLPTVLSEFWSWFKGVEGVQLWSQGANFDIPILEAAYRITGITMPWKFWNARDTRTVYDIADFKYHDETRDGVEHYALDDCMHQIKLVHAALHKLKGGGKENFR